jgi:hypothetical protein
LEITVLRIALYGFNGGNIFEAQSYDGNRQVEIVSNSK